MIRSLATAHLMSPGQFDVHNFARATPELVRQRVLQTRRDYKHLVTLDLLEALLASWQKTHAVLPAGRAEWATYRTSYWDTHQRDSYRDHVLGRPTRCKVRVRDYDDRSISTLEVKRRHARGHTVKHRVVVPFRERSLIRARHEASQLGVRQPTRASVHVSFYRLSLLHLTRPERVTIDVGLHWRGTTEHRLRNTAIVEVKGTGAASQTDSLRALRNRQIRESSFSKYCVGLCLVEPDLTTSPFVPQLKRLQRMEALCPVR